MTETTPANDRPPKWIRIVARIWSAPIILFVVFFLVGTIWSQLTNSGADPYAVGEPTVIEQLPPIFIALSALGLALAWRWEKIGGIFSLVFTAAVFFSLLLQGFIRDGFSWILIPSLLGLIILIPGILFLLVGYHASKK